MIRLRRRSRISADGNELYSFINSLHQESIACFDQYCSKDHFSGEVLFRDIKRVRELAEKYHISMKEYEYPSLLSYLSRYRKRYGLMIGAAAASALSSSMRSRVPIPERASASTVKPPTPPIPKTATREPDSISIADLPKISSVRENWSSIVNSFEACGYV